MRFLGLHLEDRIPDAKTIWHFRDTLAQGEVIRELFDAFTRQLEEAPIITREGSDGRMRGIIAPDSWGIFQE